MDNAHNRIAIIDQRNVDGELVIFVDEFLGAVQRGNQPVARPATAKGAVDIGYFFREYWEVRGECRECLGNMLVRQPVCFDQGGVSNFSCAAKSR